jgi:hypothetical protein
MSAIGRIFIVLNLILSAAFLGWASQTLATTDDYKQQLADANEANATALAEKENEISDLNVRVGEMEDAQRKFRGERDTVTADRDGLRAQLDEEKRNNAQMRTQLDEINATLGDYNATIASLTSQKDAAVQRAHEAENARDDASAAAQAAELAKRDAEEASTMAQTRIGDLESANAKLTSQVSSLETRLTTLAAITGTDPSSVNAVPQIDAAVLEARFDLEPGLVMLNVGKNQDVQRGYTFHIYRGSQYKGQVRVENVQDRYCSAVVVGLASGKTITQGDRATTVL